MSRHHDGHASIIAGKDDGATALGEHAAAEDLSTLLSLYDKPVAPSTELPHARGAGEEVAAESDGRNGARSPAGEAPGGDGQGTFDAVKTDRNEMEANKGGAVAQRAHRAHTGGTTTSRFKNVLMRSSDSV
jgi:hypothetical protein